MSKVTVAKKVRKNPWKPISTLPENVEVCWLGRRRGGAFNFIGPVDPWGKEAETEEHQNWEYWAPCEAPEFVFVTEER